MLKSYLRILKKSCIVKKTNFICNHKTLKNNKNTVPRLCNLYNHLNFLCLLKHKHIFIKTMQRTFLLHPFYIYKQNIFVFKHSIKLFIFFAIFKHTIITPKCKQLIHIHHRKDIKV